MELVMTLNEFETISLIENTTSNDKDDEFSIPIDISDIISICKDFNSLGWQVQNQIDNILEIGVEESIKTGNVKPKSLPLIKFFLRRICGNPYFGDAVSQAQDCLVLIERYEEQHKPKYSLTAN